MINALDYPDDKSYRKALKQLDGKQLPMQMTSHKDLEEVIRIFHHYCDPCDMHPEDVPVWRKWDRRFNPENYDDIQDEERDSST